MGKFLKRILASILLVGIIVGAVPNPAKAVLNKMSADDAVGWLWWHVDNNYTFGDGECVQLTKAYYKYLADSDIWGDATAYVGNAVPPGWRRIESNLSPKKGDVAVWKPYYNSAYGRVVSHVAVAAADAVDGNYPAFHQNFDFGDGAGPRRKCVYVASNSVSNLACLIRPNFGEENYADLGKTFYAYIKNPATGNALCNVNNNVQLGSAGSKNAKWKFVRQTDGTYKIYSVGTNGLLDVTDANTADGTNIQVCTSDTGSKAQNWYLAKNGNEYCIYTSLCGKALDLADGKTAVGTNVQLYYCNGSDAQFFKIEQYDNKCSHKYNDLGICSNCGEEYDWESSFTTSGKGTYTINKDGGLYLRLDKPYSASTAKSNLIKKGTQVEVLGYVKNHYDNKWYKASYNGQVGYIYYEHLTKVAVCSHSYSSKVTKAATCTSNGVRTYTCSKCSASYTENIAATGHSYASKVTTAATCSKAGVRTYTCSKCSASYTESIAATGNHNYVGKVTTPADCANAGKKTYTCSGCGKSYTETIPSTGQHNYVGKVTTAATCTKAGVKTYTCSGCSRSYTENVPATGHNYVEKVTTAASCGKAGVMTYTCSGCGDRYTQSIPATNSHNYVGKVTIPANCVSSGKKTYTCSGCGKSYTETIPSTGQHNYVGKVTTAATCTTAGKKTYTCSGCGKSYTETIPARGTHSWSEWKVDAGASCTSAGIMHRECKDCGKRETEAISSLSHDWTKKVIDSAHLRTEAVKCTEYDTYWVSCSRCNETSNRYFFAGETHGAHSFTEEVIDAAHKVPEFDNMYYYDCIYCDAIGTGAFNPDNGNLCIWAGDLDKDGSVNEDDAVYLLQHVLMPELFEMEQYVDYDRNGIVDEDDAVYLLQHVLIPDFFPI